MEKITKEQVVAYLEEYNPVFHYLFLYMESGNLGLRDLGKLLAGPNEYIQRDYIHKTTSLKVKIRNDNNLNGDGFDLITEDGVLKIQSKLRAGPSMYLEQTRRKTKKNANSSHTGQATYSVGEADIYLFSRPNTDDYLNLEKWDFIAIPETALIDPKNSKYLLPRVPKIIWKNYVGKSKKILESTYEAKKEENLNGK